MQANDIRKGMVILYNGILHRVMQFQHRTPGNLRAFVQVKLRNLINGTQTDVRFSSTESVERATLDVREMEFLYSEGDTFHFMDTQSYDQIPLDAEALGEAVDYMVPNITVTVELYEGKPVGIQMPSTVELKVVETEPELRGATAASSYKPALLETGVSVQVPPFIKEGDLIRVDPSTGSYLERAKS